MLTCMLVCLFIFNQACGCQIENVMQIQFEINIKLRLGTERALFLWAEAIR